MPRLNADSAFAIGSSHTVCQDYATHWSTEQMAFAVVCDGCSSSPKTDVGARFMAEALSSAMTRATNDPLDIPCMLQILDFPLRTVARSFHLPPDSFNATVLAVFADLTRNSLYLFVWGDGRIHIKHTDGAESDIGVDFLNNRNAPFYPSYRIFRDNGGLVEYENQFGKLNPNWDWRSDKFTKDTQQLATYPIFKFPLEGVKSVSLFSDGYSTFFWEDDNKPLTNHEMTVNEMTSFQSLEGSYIQRRFRKCQKLWRKRNVRHADDLGMAGIHLLP